MYGFYLVAVVLEVAPGDVGKDGEGVHTTHEGGHVEQVQVQGRIFPVYLQEEGKGVGREGCDEGEFGEGVKHRKSDTSTGSRKKETDR